MKISKELFGQNNLDNVYKFALSNSNGMKVEIINLGCIIVSIRVPDKNGTFADIVLGHDTLDEYLKSKCYFGAIVGRHANRIEDARFELNGTEYLLAQNNEKNHIHGGIEGFDKKIWGFEISTEDGVDILILKYLSPDGEENYPGNLDVTVRYSLSEEGELKINYQATSDKDTVVNLTNHSYFNLGNSSENILDHQVMINADKFTVINNERIPTGEICDVSRTQLDFTSHRPLRDGLENPDYHIKNGEGYDHNWILNVGGKKAEKAAELIDPISGRKMEVFTTKPGVQVYTGNFLNSSIIGKGGINYNKWSGVCFETQYFPNALKHKHFPSPILKKGDEYNHTTIYKFSTT